MPSPEMIDALERSQNRSRFKAVKDGVHVGVLDTQSNMVLDLVTIDQEISQIQTNPAADRNWSVVNTYSQVGTDKEVATRWNEVVSFWNGLVDNGQQIGYDVAGETHLNCECIVGHVMENKLAPKLGKIAGMLRGIGVNVGSLSRSSLK